MKSLMGAKLAPSTLIAPEGETRAVEHRQILEEGAVVAGGLEAHAPHFALDVRRALQVVLRAHLAAHHRVVREDVEARHQVGRRDRGGRRLRRVLERQRRLRVGCRCRDGEKRGARGDRLTKMHHRDSRARVGPANMTAAARPAPRE